MSAEERTRQREAAARMASWHPRARRLAKAYARSTEFSFMQARSATKVPEKELVRWAFSFTPAIVWLLPFVFRRRDCTVAFEVKDPVIVPGDRMSDELDVLIWPEGDYSSAIAIEAKRARIDGSTLLTEQVGGVHSIREGVEQVNSRIAQGFSEAYLALFLEVDARSFSGGFWHHTAAPTELTNVVRHEIENAGLHPDAGFLLFQVGQPVDKDVLLGGGFGLPAHRTASYRPQNPELTQRIREFADRLRKPIDDER